MSEILEKFVKNLGKLDKYYVLRDEKTHLIIGTTIKFLEHAPEEVQIFTRWQPPPKKKTLPVFFLITQSLKPLDLEKSFLKKDLPVLNLNIESKKKKISLTLKGTETFLEKWITTTFKY